MEEDDALLGPVSLGRRLEDVDEAHQRDVEAEDGVRAAVQFVLEEVVPRTSFFLLSMYSSVPKLMIMS